MEHGITRRNQLLQQQNMDALGAASSAAQLLAALKERLVVILEAYQPQGLQVEALISEFSNAYGEPLPCDAWQRLTGKKIKPRDFIDMMLDALVILPGVAGGGAGSGKERVALSSQTEAGAQEVQQERVAQLRVVEQTEAGAQEVQQSLPPAPAAPQQPERPAKQQLVPPGCGAHTEGVAAQSPAIGAPKFGIEMEDDDGGHGSVAVGAERVKGAKGAGAAGSDLSEYKEYVRQMVAHSGGRGMHSSGFRV